MALIYIIVIVCLMLCIKTQDCYFYDSFRWFFFQFYKDTLNESNEEHEGGAKSPDAKSNGEKETSPDVEMTEEGRFNKDSGCLLQR